MSGSKLSIMKVAAAKDHKQAIIDAVGDISSFELVGSDVLVGIKPEKEKTDGGIFLTDKKIEEARYQSKVGLIVAMGPTAFKYDPENPACAFEGKKPKIGDWVVSYAHESREIGVRATYCRIVPDRAIRMITTDPEAIY